MADVEGMLVQYLREDRAERKLLGEQLTIFGKELTKIATSLEHMVGRLEKLEEKEENSKVTRINELQSELERRKQGEKEDGTWWKRSGILWVVAAIGWVLSTSLTAALAAWIARK